MVSSSTCFKSLLSEVLFKIFPCLVLSALALLFFTKFLTVDSILCSHWHMSFSDTPPPHGEGGVKAFGYTPGG